MKVSKEFSIEVTLTISGTAEQEFHYTDDGCPTDYPGGSRMFWEAADGVFLSDVVIDGESFSKEVDDLYKYFPELENVVCEALEDELRDEVES